MRPFGHDGNLSGRAALSPLFGMEAFQRVAMSRLVRSAVLASVAVLALSACARTTSEVPAPAEPAAVAAVSADIAGYVRNHVNP